jgi:hypothetical protein
LRASKRQRRETLDIIEVKISGEGFAKAPPAERHIALFYGHIANDIVMVRRLPLLLAIPSPNLLDGRPKLYREFYNQQAFGLLRILAGKTREGWEALNREVDGIGARRDFREVIERNAPGALGRCGKYFGKSNAIEEIRNGFSFHMFADRWVDDQAAAVTATMGFQCYVRDGANSLYGTSEHLLLPRLIARCRQPIYFTGASSELEESAKQAMWCIRQLA